MTVRKREKVYWVDFSFNKFRYRKRSPENSATGAKAYELLLRQRLARGEPLDKKEIKVNKKFSDVVNQWFEVYVKNNNKPSEINNKNYLLKASIIPYFKDKDINEITKYEVDRYKDFLLNKMKLSPKSVNNRLSVLSKCLKSVEEWEIIENAPRIKLLKIPPQKFDFLNKTESELLLNNANGIWHDFILLALQTGLRFGEMIALRWKDIDFNKKILTVNRNIVRGIEGSPKSNKSRIVPLTNTLFIMLNERNSKNEFIFYDSNKKSLNYGNCKRNLHKICSKAGLRKIGWHVLRHTFASNLASQNNSIVAIKELLGHSDIKTTMRYSHVNLPVLQKVMESIDQNQNVTITSQTPLNS